MSSTEPKTLAEFRAWIQEQLTVADAIPVGSLRSLGYRALLDSIVDRIQSAEVGEGAAVLREREACAKLVEQAGVEAAEGRPRARVVAERIRARK